MACHEIAALRLGLMSVLGRKDETERQHELSEIGGAATEPGAVQTLCTAADLSSLRRAYEAAIAELEARVSSTRSDDANLPYLRTLVVLTKKVELDLLHQIESLTTFFRDLERMHDFVHEIYPAK
jgi:hypothetical protein